FKATVVKNMIKTILNEELLSKEYNDKEASTWSKNISTLILQKLKAEKEFENYKFIVHVLIGEQRGAGLK
ncbi:tctex1 domain-containing protein 2-like protein, partial [Dinothrombium tinctorium]